VSTGAPPPHIFVESHPLVWTYIGFVGSSAWFRYFACLFVSGAVAFLCFDVVHVNATTVALTMLLVVLGVATRWGLREGVFTSVVCLFAFNFFFLPPVGTLTIADPQNWVALTAFLVTAIVASQLSAKAKDRAEEALARRSEIERLYQLSRAMLMDEAADITRVALTPVRDIFGLSHVAFYDSNNGQVYPADVGPLSRLQLERVAQSSSIDESGEATYIPVRLGTRTIGSLGLAGARLTKPEQESIANLVAIGYERMRALKTAAEAEAARQGERLKAFVLDGIAHDLKTPLTAIKTCVTTLITIPPQSEEKRAELLNIINEETEHLHKTISAAIQLARVESQKVVLQRSASSLLEEVERVVATYPNRHRFEVRVAPDLRVTADPELLSQALHQVLENAAKYSGPNGRIEVAAERIAGNTRITVSDRGPGISPREMERIFDKFYRGTRGRDGSGGSGMGLAIAKGIIEAHGGRIRAENRPGGGAVFIMQVPET